MKRTKMAILRTAPVLLLLVLCGCADPGLLLTAQEEDGILRATLLNSTGQPIAHTQTIYSSHLQPDEDLILLLSSNGRHHSQCMRVDQVPSGRRTLAPNETILVSIGIEQLSTLFCLEAGTEYEMRVAHIVGNGESFDILDVSNPQSVIARPGHRGGGNVTFSISADGTKMLRSDGRRPK